MTIDFAGDLEELLTTDGHGVVVERDDNTRFNGILNREFFEQFVNEEPAIAGSEPGLYASTKDVVSLAEGDRLRFYDVKDDRETLIATLRVATEHEPDGWGMSRVAMRKA